MTTYVKTGTTMFSKPVRIPDLWQFVKHGFRYAQTVWKLAEATDHVDASRTLNPYDVRVEAVKLKRTYITAGIAVPAWLKELTK